MCHIRRSAAELCLKMRSSGQTATDVRVEVRGRKNLSIDTCKHLHCMSVYVCVGVCIYICVCVCVCVDVCMSLVYCCKTDVLKIPRWAYVSVSLCVCMCLHVCVFGCVHVCAFVY